MERIKKSQGRREGRGRKGEEGEKRNRDGDEARRSMRIPSLPNVVGRPIHAISIRGSRFTDDT